MTGQPIKLGVVGCGFTGRQTIFATTVMSRMTTVALADLDPARREEVAGEYSVPRVYADYREILEDDDIDAVYLGTAPDVRLPMVLETLAAGKHALVQKPHAIRATEITEMADAAQAANKTLQFCYFMRHFPKQSSRFVVRSSAVKLAIRTTLGSLGNTIISRHQTTTIVGCMSTVRKEDH